MNKYKMLKKQQDAVQGLCSTLSRIGEDNYCVTFDAPFVQIYKNGKKFGTLMRAASATRRLCDLLCREAVAD